jgi:hypothetical protein
MKSAKIICGNNHPTGQAYTLKVDNRWHTGRMLQRFNNIKMTPIEIQSFTIYDSGDPSVGMPATQFEFSGGFVFDSQEIVENFKIRLLDYCIGEGLIEGRAMVITNVEHASRMELEKIETTND